MHGVFVIPSDRDEDIAPALLLYCSVDIATEADCNHTGERRRQTQLHESHVSILLSLTCHYYARARLIDHSRSLLDVVIQLLELVACVEVPDADKGHVVRPRGLLLPSGHKTAVGMDVDALDVIVMAEEEALGGLILIKQVLPEHHPHCPRVVYNLSDGPVWGWMR